MTALHSQEKLIEALDYKGTTVDLIEWAPTVWCGKVGYATNNTDEPNVDDILTDYSRLDGSTVKGKFNPVRDCCISVNYMSTERPNGVMFGEMVQTDEQSDGFDILRIPVATFMRILICDETANALNKEPWHGGIPPYAWIYDLLAPHFGYKPASDTLPIIEYYGHYKQGEPLVYENKLCYLYVPVQKW